GAWGGGGHGGTTIRLNRRIWRIAAKSLALLVTTVAPMDRAESGIKTSFTKEEPAVGDPRASWSARSACPASSLPRGPQCGRPDRRRRPHCARAVDREAKTPSRRAPV